MLTRKIGPLPLWAWVGIAAAGIVAGIYLRRRIGQSASSQSSQVPAAGGTGSPGSSYPDVGGAVSGGGTGSGIAPVAAGIDPTQYVSDVLGSFERGGSSALGTYQAGEQGGLALLQTAEGFFTSPGGGFTGPQGPPGPPGPPGKPAHSTKKAVAKAKAAPAHHTNPVTRKRQAPATHVARRHR